MPQTWSILTYAKRIEHTQCQVRETLRRATEEQEHEEEHSLYAQTNTNIAYI